MVSHFCDVGITQGPPLCHLPQTAPRSSPRGQPLLVIPPIAGGLAAPNRPRYTVSLRTAPLPEAVDTPGADVTLAEIILVRLPTGSVLVLVSI